MSTSTPLFLSFRKRVAAWTRRAERVVFRPIAVFVTFVLCVFALLQVAGRVAIHAMPNLEGQLNAALAERGIVISGLAGRWHGLNPIITASQVNFPAGQVSHLVVELDVLESAWHSALVPRLVRVGDAEVHAEKTPAGWRLVGMGTEPLDIDLAAALAEGDDMRASGVLVLHDAADVGGPVAKIAGALKIGNVGADHYLGLAVNNVASGAQDLDEAGLSLEVWRRDQTWPVQEASTAATASGALTLPRLVTGMDNAHIAVNYLGWRDTGEQGGGLIEAEVSGLRLGEGQHPLGLTLTIDGQRTEAGI